MHAWLLHRIEERHRLAPWVIINVVFISQMRPRG
jgi:hypothetical protein